MEPISGAATAAAWKERLSSRVESLYLLVELVSCADVVCEACVIPSCLSSPSLNTLFDLLQLTIFSLDALTYLTRVRDCQSVRVYLLNPTIRVCMAKMRAHDDLFSPFPITTRVVYPSKITHTFTCGYVASISGAFDDLVAQETTRKALVHSFS